MSPASIAGCDGGRGGGAVPLEAVPTALADVWCDAAETCIGRLADRTQAAPTCRSGVEGSVANGVVPLWEAAIEAGTGTYDPVLARQCLGEACESAAECLSGRCAGGVCAAPVLCP